MLLIVLPVVVVGRFRERFTGRRRDGAPEGVVVLIKHVETSSFAEGSLCPSAPGPSPDDS